MLKNVSPGLIESIKDLKISLNELTVYDLNVYSSIEIYYKVANKLNEVIKELSRFEGVLSDEVIKQNEKLIYLLGEGLEVEVVKEIDNLIKKGFFEELINEKIFSDLNNKIDTFKSEIDLQLEHKANETDLDVERKRIDSFTKLEEGSTTGDAELIDARITYNGLKYDNAGESIREQAKHLNLKIDTNTNFVNMIGKKEFEIMYQINYLDCLSERRLLGDAEGFSTNDTNYKIVRYDISNYQYIYIKNNGVYQFQSELSVRNINIEADRNKSRTLIADAVIGDIDTVVYVPKGAKVLVLSMDINDTDEHIFGVTSKEDRLRAEFIDSEKIPKSVDTKITIDECGVYPIVLSNNATEEYSCPIAGGDATCLLNYHEFLEKFFDCYVGVDFLDGYKVKKRPIGRDSSNKYDIFEYDFCPKYYNRTVLISGGMNANELPGEFGIAYFIKSLMEHTEAGYEYLYKNVRFKIIPILCPWSFDQSPILYDNYNGVSLNQNFDYRNCWDNISGAGSDRKGQYACDQAETQIILKWLNENAYKAELWIDCHTSPYGITGTAPLYYTVTSDSNTNSIITSTQKRITQAYADAGYFELGTDKTGSSSGVAPSYRYPKHLYSVKECGIPSIMIEQYTGNPLYGGVNELSNTKADIDNYVTMLRAYTLAILQRKEIVYDVKDLYWKLYQLCGENHSKNTNIDSCPFELGSIDNFGGNMYKNNRCRSIPIHVNGGDLIIMDTDSEYFIIELHEYDANGAWLGRVINKDDSSIIHTSSSNTAFIKYVIKRKDESIMHPTELINKIVFSVNGVGDDERFTHGTINNTGGISIRPDRLLSTFIKKENNKIVIINNIEEYDLIDVVLFNSDKQFVRIDNKINKTLTAKCATLHINKDDGDYIRFSMKRTDGGSINLRDLNHIRIISY